MSAASLTANLAAYLLQTTVLLAVGLLLPPLFRLDDPAVRLRYLRALLVFSLALPFAAVVMVPGEAVGTSVTRELAGGMEVVVRAGPRSFAPWPWLLGLLACVAAARMSWVLAGLFALARLRRRSPSLDPLPPAFEEASRALGVNAEFRVSERVSSPLTFGWIHPVILLPEGIEAMSRGSQQCIALHELCHVRRRDWPAILLEESLCSLLWFHPAIWLTLERIALCREQVVDREVVRLTEERGTYMHTLAAMARTRHGAAAVAILPFFHRSHLLQRLALLTKEVSMSKFRLGLVAASCTCALLLAGALAARAFPLVGRSGDVPATAASAQKNPPSAIQPAGPKVYEMGTKGIKAPKLLKQVNPGYPEEARQKGISGRVVLQTVINEKGEPTELKVLKSQNDLLSASAMEAVAQWRWESPTLHGKPVNVRWTITINFSATP